MGLESLIEVNKRTIGRAPPRKPVHDKATLCGLPDPRFAIILPGCK
ncbi:hypothetical protein HNO92_000528 [Chromobacterium alkanivorans]|nr:MULTISPECIES: hypothetical protein [Chromobacterium]MBN3002481.1 hypothetical protein [Chromobacterium alkanivorans]MCS3802878.1 hypothetical protein [Chromobacterium alkanivorans]MCS3817204.1 hypothetical protein [Chromobacterium alkanivorans]MCS3872244.1 hypothetical protein [Chromobacterium alkanivorans]